MIHLLHNNGIDVSNSKEAYQQLKQYESNPFFCMLLSCVFAAAECPVPDLGLRVDWIQYRQIAGLTLKNNLTTARYGLGEEAIVEAARCSLTALSTSTNVQLSRVSAQIIVKITQLTSFGWWTTSGIGDLASLLLNDLLQAGDVRSLGALYALQYVMEDIPKEVGAASESVIVRVAAMATNAELPLHLRKAAFRMCCNIYEQASLLDWNIDDLSPLQSGLVKASWSLAGICSSLLASGCDGDSSFLVDVLHTCWFLLDYFDYFPEGMSIEDQRRLQQSWIDFPVQTLCSRIPPGTQDEVLSAAMELIERAIEVHENSGGESYASFLIANLPNHLSVLLESLVMYCELSAEEISDILVSDSYELRSHTAVIVKSAMRDITEDNIVEDTVAATTLRRCALKCIESTCSFDSNASFSLLMQHVQLLWSNSEWKSREVSFVLLGTLAAPCFTQLHPVLPNAVEQLMAVIRNDSEHICVVSMAIWSLSRMLDSALVLNTSHFDDAIHVIASRLKSPSKRIQQSAISALHHAFTLLQKLPDAAASQSRLSHIFSCLTPTICECIAWYHTDNLSLLVDMVILVLPCFPPGTPTFDALATSIKKDRVQRAALFEASYTAAYVTHTPNVLLDKDIFSFDRALAVILSLQPDAEMALASVQTWSSVLKDIIDRGVDDDPDLIFGTILMGAGYIRCVRTADFQRVAPCATQLASSALHMWSITTQREIKIASVTLLLAITQCFGPSGCIDSTTSDAIHAAISRDISDEDPRFKKNLVALGCEMVGLNLNHPSASSTYAAINSVLRSDVFSDSLQNFIGMAASVCKLVSQQPSLLCCTRLDVIAQLLAQSTNDITKAEATINLCSPLGCLPAEALSQYASHLLALLYSWQQASLDFPGAAQSLASMVTLLQQQCGGVVREAFSYLPRGLLAMLQATYPMVRFQ